MAITKLANRALTYLSEHPRIAFGGLGAATGGAVGYFDGLRDRSKEDTRTTKQKLKHALTGAGIGGAIGVASGPALDRFEFEDMRKIDDAWKKYTTKLASKSIDGMIDDVMSDFTKKPISMDSHKQDVDNYKASTKTTNAKIRANAPNAKSPILPAKNARILAGTAVAAAALFGGNHLLRKHLREKYKNQNKKK